MWKPLNTGVGRDILRQAHNNAPDETCGFIIGDAMAYIPVKNCHPEPTEHFTMEESAMLEILTTAAQEVDGIYHSHPKGTKYPSTNDVGIMRAYPNFQFWIVTYNNVYEWRLVDDKPRPVRRDGTTGIDGMAYPLLEVTTPV